MKITKEYLRKIIKESLQEVNQEGDVKPTSYAVEDESGREEDKTFSTMQEVEDYLKKLDQMGADLYNIIIRPKFK